MALPGTLSPWSVTTYITDGVALVADWVALFARGTDGLALVTAGVALGADGVALVARGIDLVALVADHPLAHPRPVQPSVVPRITFLFNLRQTWIVTAPLLLFPYRGRPPRLQVETFAGEQRSSEFVSICFHLIHDNVRVSMDNIVEERSVFCMET